MVLFSRSRVKRTSLLALTAFLFLQAALALSACVAPAQTLAHVISEGQTSHCGDKGPSNPNLCLAHCAADSQSAQSDAVEPLASLLTFAPIAFVRFLPLPRDRAGFAPFLFRVSDPPIPIRFRSLLI